MADYGSPSYWNERYTSESDVFEWYQPYSALKSHLHRYITSFEAQILHVGAELPLEMYDSGFHHQICIDCSDVCVTKMSERLTKYSGIQYCTMDARQLDLKTGPFDAVLDKGMLDCLLCGEKAAEDAHSMLSCISNILKPNGYYILITYGSEDNRKNILCDPRYDWSLVETIKIGKLINGLHGNGQVVNNVLIILEKPQVSINGRDLAPSQHPGHHYIYILKMNK